LIIEVRHSIVLYTMPWRIIIAKGLYRRQGCIHPRKFETTLNARQFLAIQTIVKLLCCFAVLERDVCGFGSCINRLKLAEVLFSMSVK
jgi:hypothetical protein